MSSNGVSPALAIPKGSLVLVTGASSYIASHTVLEFLKHGYRVRGAVRNRRKAAFFSEGVFEQYSANKTLELVDVPDMTAPGAYKEAVKGVAAVVDIASIVNMDPDPDNVIPGVVGAVLDLLRTAAAEPSVKRFVYCSSIATVYSINTRTDNHVTINQDSWNTDAVQQAYKKPYGPDNGFNVYQASKIEAEKAAWRFVKEEKPSFVFNTVHPFTVFGPVFSKDQLTSTAGWVKGIYDGTFEPPPGFFSHASVKDIGAIHYAAVVDPEVSGQRIITGGEKLNWNMVLDVLRRAYPDRKIREDFPGVSGVQGETFDVDLATSLLKKWVGRDGWIPAEESIIETIESAR